MELLFWEDTLSNSFSGSAFRPFVWTLAESFTSWMRFEYSSCFWFSRIVSISCFFRSLYLCPGLKPYSARPSGPALLLEFEPCLLFCCEVGTCSPESSDIYSKRVVLLLLLFDAEESTELSVVGFWWFDSNFPLTNMLVSYYFFLSFCLEGLRFEPLPALLLSEPDDWSRLSGFLLYSVWIKPNYAFFVGDADGPSFESWVYFFFQKVRSLSYSRSFLSLSNCCAWHYAAISLASCASFSSCFNDSDCILLTAMSLVFLSCKRSYSLSFSAICLCSASILYSSSFVVVINALIWSLSSSSISCSPT